jgi:hypothetical protein
VGGMEISSFEQESLTRPVVVETSRILELDDARLAVRTEEERKIFGAPM